MHTKSAPKLDDYQWQLIRNVADTIQRNYLSKQPNIKILDAGCDCSGKQIRHLADLTTGEVVGINIEDGFPSRDAVELTADKPNAKLVKMDATRLEFPDETFDMVVSANVMEHVQNPEAYIRECARVLKKSGIANFEAAPVWTSARGHHIHEDLVQSCCNPEDNYRNDGSIIPDWSHLKYGEGQLRSLIEPKLRQKTVSWILYMIYHSDALNKRGWREICNSFDSIFPITDFRTTSTSGADIRLKPIDALEDYDTEYFQLWGRKTPQPMILRLLAQMVAAYRRRLRLLGYAVSNRVRTPPIKN